jgi:hypothetical protein
VRTVWLLALLTTIILLPEGAQAQASWPDPLDDIVLICPYQNEGTVVDPFCTSDMPPGPDRRPKDSGKMEGVNRIPEYDFVSMLQPEPEWQSCGRIFDDAELARAVGVNASRSTSRLLQVRAELLKGVRQIRSWGYCHRERQVPGRTIHAYFLESQQIMLFSSACDPLTIYDDDISHFNYGHRFYLVVSHEVGHAVDGLFGPLATTDDERVAAELRATWLGTFFAQCFSVHWQQILQDSRAADRTAAQRDSRERIVKSWRKLERDITRLRKGIAARLKSQRSGKHVGLASITPLEQAFACSSPRPQK